MTSEDRIAKLEAQIDDLQEAQTKVSRHLVEARIEQWQARIDDLEVQIHLGTVEAKDRLTALSDELQSRWSTVRRQMEDASTTTTEVVDTLKSGVEGAYNELRNALLDSRKQLG